MVAAGERFRDGVSDRSHAALLPGVAPFGPWQGDPQGPSWDGHQWTDWTSLRPLSAGPATPRSGLYRIRGSDSNTLLYIGQGKIRGRLLAHLAKTANPQERQGSILAAQQRLECSWTINDEWLPHQRLELENDLIAAHMLRRT
jgi:hypothetical protein